MKSASITLHDKIVYIGIAQICVSIFTDASDSKFPSTTEILSTIENFNKFNEIDENTEIFFMMAEDNSLETYKVFKNIVFYMSAARVSNFSKIYN